MLPLFYTSMDEYNFLSNNQTSITKSTAGQLNINAQFDNYYWKSVWDSSETYDSSSQFPKLYSLT
jgi:hypothetical protein